jgi:hypothetical protein
MSAGTMENSKPNCAVVDRALDRGFARRGSPPAPEVQTHLEECERCRALYRYLGQDDSLSQDAPAPASSRGVEQRIVASLRPSLRPVPRLRSNAALAAQFIAVFLLIAAAVISRMKLAGYHAMSMPQLTGISAILVCGAVLLALSLARQMAPGSLRKLPDWASVAIPVAGLVAGIVLLFPWKRLDAFVVMGWPCLRAGLAMAVPAALIFALSIRRGAPLNLISLGATLGAIAGLLGVTVLQYTCDLQNIAHLLVWHSGVLLLSTNAGALLGGCAERFAVRPR